MNALSTIGYWALSPGVGVLRPTELSRAVGEDVMLSAICTGVSPGTERLVGAGAVPREAAAPMAVPGMQGTFTLPILYGYAFVGRCEHGANAGRRAFTMRPHLAATFAATSACVWLPDAVPSPRATLFPNLETALNGVWDAELSPGAEVVVIGAGAVGSLVAFVLASLHDGPVTVVERDVARREAAAALPFVRSAIAPDVMPRDHFAVAFHCSGNGGGLQSALDAVGREGTVVELSWYGERTATLALGGSCHWLRKRLVFSQVGTVAPRHRAAGHAARSAEVLRLLHDERLDALLAPPTQFEALPELFARMHRGEPTPLCPVVAFA